MVYDALVLDYDFSKKELENDEIKTFLRMRNEALEDWPHIHRKKTKAVGFSYRDHVQQLKIGNLHFTPATNMFFIIPPFMTPELDLMRKEHIETETILFMTYSQDPHIISTISAPCLLPKSILEQRPEDIKDGAHEISYFPDDFGGQLFLPPIHDVVQNLVFNQVQELLSCDDDSSYEDAQKWLHFPGETTQAKAAREGAQKSFRIN